jgi:hypothetical protein
MRWWVGKRLIRIASVRSHAIAISGGIFPNRDQRTQKIWPFFSYTHPPSDT